MMAVQLICYMDEGEKNLGFVCVCVFKQKAFSNERNSVPYRLLFFFYYTYLFTVGSVEGFALADMH